VLAVIFAMRSRSKSKAAGLPLSATAFAGLILGVAGLTALASLFGVMYWRPGDPIH
jgi:hypothetical protein